MERPKVLWQNRIAFNDGGTLQPPKPRTIDNSKAQDWGIKKLAFLTGIANHRPYLHIAKALKQSTYQIRKILRGSEEAPSTGTTEDELSGWNEKLVEMRDLTMSVRQMHQAILPEASEWHEPQERISMNGQLAKRVFAAERQRQDLESSRAEAKSNHSRGYRGAVFDFGDAVFSYDECTLSSKDFAGRRWRLMNHTSPLHLRRPTLRANLSVLTSKAELIRFQPAVDTRTGDDADEFVSALIARAIAASRNRFREYLALDSNQKVAQQG